MNLAYSSNAYMRHGVTHAIERIAALGYRGVELMADTPHLWPATTTDEQLREVRTALDRNGLTIANINAFMMNAVQDFWHPSWIEPDRDFRQLRIDHTKASLVMARKLGATCITTEPGGPRNDGQSRDEAMDLFAAGLTDVLRVAEEQDVMLLVEPEPDLLIENADQFMELTQRVSSPKFGLNFDAGHFFCVSDPLPETVHQLSNFTRHYHLEDIAHTRVHEHLIPGDGAIDFAALLGAIAATNYDGWLTVELYPYLDDPDGAGAAAKRHLERWLGA